MAEVLITLGIIGIVAAMTLPALIQKQQTKSILVSLNKSYAELQNIVNLISNEHGEDIGNVIKLYDDEQTKNLFMKYYDNAKDCSNNSCYKEDIIYYTYAGDKINITTGNTPNSNYYFSKNKFLTKEGRLIIFGGTNKHGRMISVDVNGPFKKPNAWGRDVFTFRVMEKQIMPCGGKIHTTTIAMNRRKAYMQDLAARIMPSLSQGFLILSIIIKNILQVNYKDPTIRVFINIFGQ